MSGTQLPDEIVRAFLVERFDDFLSLEQGSAVQTREAYRRDVLRLAGVRRHSLSQASRPT